jgi:hypothetical protein
MTQPLGTTGMAPSGSIHLWTRAMKCPNDCSGSPSSALRAKLMSRLSPPGGACRLILRERSATRSHRIADYERRYRAGESGGFTFAMWDEVRSAVPDSPKLGESDWGLVFDLVRRLTRDSRFPAHRIRFVVWYNW